MHHAEASSLFLIERLKISEKKEVKYTTDMDVAKREISKLQSELLEVNKVFKDKESELMTQKVETDELLQKIKLSENQIGDLTS